MIVRTCIILVVIFPLVKADVCLTKGCVTTAAFLLKSMDTTVNPCTDFYEYVCGNYGKNFPLNFDMPIRSTLAVRQEEFLAEVKVLLDAKKNFVESDSMQKAKNFYNTCMNATVQEEVKAIKTYVDEFIGGIPMITEDWSDENFNWQEMLIYLISRGFQNTGIFDVKILSTTTNGNFKFQIVYRPSALQLIFDNGHLDEEETRQHVAEALQEVVVALGKEVEDVANQTLNVVDFMYSYLKIPTFSLPITSMTIAELVHVIPEFDWIKLFQKLTRSEINKETIVRIEGIEWLQRVIEFAENVDNKLMANYLVTNSLGSLYINNMFPVALNTAIKTIIVSKMKKLFPYEIEKSNSAFCVEYASQISNAVKAAHFKHYIQKDVEYSVTKLIQKIIHTYIQHANQNPETQEISNLLSRLLESTSMVVGVDQQYLNNAFVDNEYAKLFSHRISHLINTLSLKRFKRKQQLVNKGYLKTIGLQQPDVTCVANESEIQQISVPLSLLRGIVFSTDRGFAFNYGTLGFKIMQGLINCFSKFSEFTENNIVYDKSKNSDSFFHPDVIKLKEFKNLPEWSRKTLEKIVDVDYQALKHIYHLYLERLSNYKTDVYLPGIDANSKQLFWLGYTSLHCQAYKERYTKHLKFFTGDLNKLSVLSVVHKFQEFSDDFECLETTTGTTGTTGF